MNEEKSPLYVTLNIFFKLFFIDRNRFKYGFAIVKPLISRGFCLTNVLDFATFSYF